MRVRRHHVDDGVHVHDAGAAVDAPDRVAGGNRRPDELSLELVAAAVAEGKEPASIPRGESDERDLVDRGVEGHPPGVRLDESRCLGGEAGEAGRKLGRPHVDAVGPPVMAEGPHDLHAVAFGGGGHRGQRREVEAAAALDEVPADGVADRCDPDAAKPLVVLIDLPVVLRGGNHVEAPSGPGDVRRRLESPDPERIEDVRDGRRAGPTLHAPALPGATGS